jgi:glycosyltransferase involved in cell wall biosynthesis
MRILVAHSRYRSTVPSGENAVVDQEVAALAAAGQEVEVFERCSDDIAGWSLPRKLTLPAHSVWSEEVRRSLMDRIASWRPDVVHVHNTFPMLSPSVLYACARMRVPVVMTLHNYRLLCARGDFLRKGQPCRDCVGTLGGAGIRRGCYRDSRAATIPVVVGNAIHRSAWQRLVSAYVFISAAQRDLMSSLDLPSQRVFVKHNFVVAPDVVDGNREHLITYVGRLDAPKGLPLLMHAWDAFRRGSEARLRLVIVGDGPMDREVRTWARQHDSVEIVGMVPRAAVHGLLSRGVAAVAPSRALETFGLVAVEAMAAAVAPIAPAHGAFPELITDGVEGRLFTPGDEAALADVFRAVERCPERFIELGRAGRAAFERRFQGGSSVEQLLTIYRYAIQNPVRP